MTRAFNWSVGPGALSWFVRASALLCCLCVVCATRAEPAGKREKTACIKARGAGQQHMQGGRLLAARERLVTCATEQCPDSVRKECAKLLAEVSPAIPSIVLAATDPAGNDVADVRVTLDGELLVDMLDGKPIMLEPGPHTLRFERKGSPPIEREIIAQAGIKLREVKVRFEAEAKPVPAATVPPPAPPSDPTPPPEDPTPPPEQPAAPLRDVEQQADSSRISPLVVLGFGAAGLGAIVGSITGGLSYSQALELKDECPDDLCDPQKQDEIDRMMILGHVSTASFVVAGVGAAVGVIALIAGGSEPSESSALVPVLAPGLVGLRGSF